MNRTQALKQKPFDEQQWHKLYYRYQQQYLRNRLDAMRLLMQGHTRSQVCQQLGCTYDTLTSWMDKYLQGGLEQLVSAITHNKPARLTLEQQQLLKAMVRSSASSATTALTASLVDWSNYGTGDRATLGHLSQGLPHLRDLG